MFDDRGENRDAKEAARTITFFSRELKQDQASRSLTGWASGSVPMSPFGVSSDFLGVFSSEENSCHYIYSHNGPKCT